jgi:hypothetical protein
VSAFVLRLGEAVYGVYVEYRANEMRQIPLGARGTSALRVQPEHLANRFKDAMLPQVLATPVMILIMENAALNASDRFWTRVKARSAQQ